MKYCIKSPGYSGKTDWEIHKGNCKDNFRDDPIQTCFLEADSPQDVIKKDGGENEPERYKIMPCTKSL